MPECLRPALALCSPLPPSGASHAEKPRSAIAPARLSRPHRSRSGRRRLQDFLNREAEANVTEPPQELLIGQASRVQLQQASDGLNQHFRAAKRRIARDGS